ncbi:hypothetical protein VCR4J2_40058 [Vibrio coralliirubri]|nr:hypothetical protein VCR4J2_40058 [Vibrio coralliirubri]
MPQDNAGMVKLVYTTDSKNFVLLVHYTDKTQMMALWRNW